jgi:hypothetical protein
MAKVVWEVREFEAARHDCPVEHDQPGVMGPRFATRAAAMEHALIAAGSPDSSVQVWRIARGERAAITAQLRRSSPGAAIATVEFGFGEV